MTRISSKLFAILCSSLSYVSFVPAARADNMSYQIINVPGADYTEAFGINNSGQIVGSDVSAGVRSGFLDSGGIFTPISVPGSTYTNLTGINNSGQIVGYYDDSNGVTHGFLFSGGTFAALPIDIPEGINDSGQIVGSTGADLFLDSGGNITPIIVPGVVAGYGPFPGGINNSGQIVGSFFDGSADHGFLDDMGSFTAIDVPGTNVTFGHGINNSGQIVGRFQDAIGNHGFLDSGGTFTTLNVRGESYTEAFGINDSGQVVGIFDDCCSGVPHAFLATPVPEPSSMVLLVTMLGLVGVGIARTVRKLRA